MINKENRSGLKEMTQEYKKNGLHTAEQRSARLENARCFLGVLLAHIRENRLTGSEEVHELYKTFRQEHPGLGNDFDLGQTWWIAFQQHSLNECLRENAPDKLPSDADYVKVALELLNDAADEQLEQRGQIEATPRRLM